jgi:L,D-peptidoglycan transpeptidase YkuD (ErfK/YbiS/YcfS/YnhG family)
MTRRRTLRTAGIMLGVTALAALGTACGPGASIRVSAADRATTTTSSATPSSTTTPAPTTTSTTTRPTPIRTITPTRRPATVASRATPRAPSAPRCVGIPSWVRSTQVVLVDAAGSSATVRACARVGGTWVSQLGPYYGHVGQRGVSWSKREGDLATPAGTYPLRGGFGIYSNPGLRGTWFTTSSSDVWVDDSGSSLYNTHQRTPANGRWSRAEALRKSPAYNYAQVIGYNESRTPGKGSAIFLHVDLGHGTAGCVSVPGSALVALLRWERPGAQVTINP